MILDLDGTTITALSGVVLAIGTALAKTIHYLHDGWKKADAKALELADHYHDEMRDLERMLREEGVRKIAQLEALVADKIREENERRYPPPSKRKLRP